MTKDLKTIIDGLELIHICCETIGECGGCNECPMGENCFEYNSLLDSYEDIPASKWQEFIDFADDVDEYMKEKNMTYKERQELDMLDEYDSRRKGERDERYIEENYG